MGHFVFSVLHLIALLFIPVGLLLTIPLHLIYGVSRKKTAAAATGWTHVKCPDCKEIVDKQANVCKHCGCKLIPANEQPAQGIVDRIFNGPKTMGVKRSN